MVMDMAGLVCKESSNCRLKTEGEGRGAGRKDGIKSAGRGKMSEGKTIKH